MTATADRENIIRELVTAPEDIRTAQAEVLTRTEKLEKARAVLKTREGELLLTGAIDGKNAEQRAAQLWEQTREERARVETAEAELSRARLNLDYAYNHFKALRSIAQIWGGGVDDK